MDKSEKDFMERIKRLWAGLDKDPEYLNECIRMMEREFAQMKAERDRLKEKVAMLVEQREWLRDKLRICHGSYAWAHEGELAKQFPQDETLKEVEGG